MHIDQIRVLYLAMPRSKPAEFGTRRLTTTETVLVGMSSGGVTGWGEASPGTVPESASEWAHGAFLCLKEWLAPELLGVEVPSGGSLAQRLAHVTGNAAGKAALDIAWWNLKAQQENRPLAELLGSTVSNVPLGSVFGVQSSIDELIDGVRQAIAAGHQSIGLKFRPGWSLEVVRAIRESLSNMPLWIDADGLCSLEQREMFFRLEDFYLERIEQPFAADDLVAHAMLQESLRTPVALDQSISSPGRLEQAIDLVSCRHVRLNPQRLGGITPTLALAEVCRKTNPALQCLLGVNQQTSIGLHASLALAAAGICEGPVDFVPLDPACGDLAGCFESVRNAAGEAEISAAEFALPSPAPSRVSLERFLMAQAMLAL
ncbi:MAG TPA: enolase C-terminal domain-like protein [Pirellulales bacterium]|jgi:O-succinylbenzoate synthase|nr:enolase C-terminal domain-like protein [Pirellulales bacterium]